MEKDVVCGMMVNPRTAQARSEHNGKIYYFCSEGCQATFETSPAKYADPQAPGHRK